MSHLFPVRYITNPLVEHSALMYAIAQDTVDDPVDLLFADYAISLELIDSKAMKLKDLEAL